MNGYRAPTPRPVMVIAAIAMAAVTFGLFVVVPAQMAAGGARTPTSIASTKAVPAASEVAIIPLRIEVIGERESKTAFDRVHRVQPKQNRAS